MEGLLDFLADNYLWFAGVSVFFAFALIGLVYESKKKKKEEKNTADAVAQPVQAAPAAQAEENKGVVVAANPNEGQVVTDAPSLAGLEANTSNFNNLNETPQEQTLVIDDNNQAPAAPAEPSLVIEDPNAPAPSAEPTLVIEDKPAAPATPEVAQPAAPVEPQTLGNPGQPPM